MSATVIAFPDQDERPESGPVKIYLGCNQNPLPGYVNVDIEKYDGVDVVADLEKPWPWPENHADEVYTADLPEHIRVWYETYDLDGCTTIEDVKNALRNPRRTYGIIHFMNECFRVLKPGGLFRFKIPTTENNKAWAQDPTHVSYWNENTMLYFIRGGYGGIYPKTIKACFEPLDIRTLMPNQRGESWMIGTLRKPK